MLIDYITSGPVVCMSWEGVGVVASTRTLIGETNPLNAESDTTRGDFTVQTGRNVVHGSDCPYNGKREIVITSFWDEGFHLISMMQFALHDLSSLDLFIIRYMVNTMV